MKRFFLLSILIHFIFIIPWTIASPFSWKLFWESGKSNVPVHLTAPNRSSLALGKTQWKSSNAFEYLFEPGIQQSPQLISNPVPRYPLEALERGWQGLCTWKAKLNRQGQLEQIQLLQSSGYSKLDQSAFDALKTWQWLPAKDSNGTAEVWVQVPVRFQISNP